MSERNTLEGVRVRHVGGDKLTRIIYGMMYDHLGCEAVEYESGKLAIENLRVAPVDILRPEVLMVGNMPTKERNRLLRQIRKFRPDMAVVSIETDGSILNKGTSDASLKIPSDVEELPKAIRSALDESRPRRLSQAS